MNLQDLYFLLCASALSTQSMCFVFIQPNMQFVEIKVNVFKRVDKTNLCQITYSDVRERFHYMVLLFFVFVRNMKELQWNWGKPCSDVFM